MKNNFGFTGIEVLLSFMITTLAVSLMLHCYPLIRSFVTTADRMQRIIGIEQLRDILYLSDSFIVYSDCIECRYLGETITIEIDGERIVKRDGYQILLEEVEEGEFDEKGECIYLRLVEHGEKKEIKLKC